MTLATSYGSPCASAPQCRFRLAMEIASMRRDYNRARAVMTVVPAAGRDAGGADGADLPRRLATLPAVLSSRSEPRSSHTPLWRAAAAKSYPQAVNILVDTWWISTDLGG